MALSAGFKIVGRTLYHPFMGLILVLGIAIAFVTDAASQAEVEIFAQEPGIHEVALIVVFRPDRRRRARSTFPLASDQGWFDQTFQFGIVRMAGHAGVGVSRRRKIGYRNEHHSWHKHEQRPILHVTSFSLLAFTNTAPSAHGMQDQSS